MSKGIRLRVSGDYALFTRPEVKAERVSYDCMTPSAARGILEAILWHPGLKWKIDGIRVLNPIRFTNIRRNEVKSKIPAAKALAMFNGGEPTCLNVKEDIMQRAAMVLIDVDYVISAHFDMTDKASPTDSPEKFYAMACRRMRKGQNYHQPCFGVREFPCKYTLIEEDEPTPETETSKALERDLGLMLYDMDYSNARNITPIFFRAVLSHGDLDLKEVKLYR